MAEEIKNQAKISAAEEIKKELEAAKISAEENLNGWKRAKADLINFQKDAEKQKQELIMFSMASYVLAALPIYESMEKLLDLTDKTEIGNEYKEGVKNIKKQFDDLFKNFGVTKIKTTGEKFDPNFHEAIAVKKEEGKETDIILEEARTGYLLGEKVIRPAKVVVAE